MRSPTKMKSAKASKGSGPVAKASLVQQKLTKKSKSVSAVPSATRGQKKKIREAKIRELLQVNDGVTPTPTETEKATIVMDLEEEILRRGNKNKDLIEKKYKAALIALSDELKKRKAETGSRDDPINLKEQCPDEEMVDNVAEAFLMETPTRNQINGKAWADLSDSDEQMLTEAFASDLGSGRMSPKNGKGKEVSDEPEERPEESLTFTNTEVTGRRNSIDKVLNANQEAPLKGKVENVYAKASSLKKRTMAEMVIGESEEVKAKGKYTFRIRGIYQTSQPDATELSLFTEKQRILNLFAAQLKIVDPKAKIVSWKGTERHDFIAQNLERLAPQAAEKYVGMPNNRRSLGSAKNKMGFRINSNLTLDQFIDSWGKYRKDEGWVFICQAEMQQSPTAYAVGACQGSSPNMLTNIINERLKRLIVTETLVEVSFQQVERRDMGAVVSEYWKNANDKAANNTPSGTSKNRTKNLYSPAALLVYVSDVRFKKAVKRLMMEKFGSGRTTKEWARWPDGSMMRFIPFLPPTSNRRSLEKINAMMSHQIFTKANETVRDINVIDIFTPQEYLKGKTLQEVILAIKSDKLQGMSSFKHVVRRWTRDPLEDSYAVTSFATLTDEADTKALGLMDVLHEEYGNEVLRHFAGVSLLDSHQYNRNTRNEREDEADPIIEKMLQETDGVVDHILEPGFVSMIEWQDAGLGGESTVQSSIKDDSLNMIQEDPIEVMSEDDVSKLTDMSDDATVVTGTTINTLNSKSTLNEWKEVKTISRKLKEINATKDDIEKWKKENPIYLPMLQTISKGDDNKLSIAIIRLLEEEKGSKKEQPPDGEGEQPQGSLMGP